MTELLTAAQMQAIEQAAIASGAVTGLELMERAGHGVVEAIFEEWPDLGGPVGVAASERGPAPTPPGYLQQEEGRRAVVMCGPGNNGGDGFVVARLLFERGWAVEVFLYGDAERLPPDARVNYERWGEMGEVRDIGAIPPGAMFNAALVVDAVFGTGLTRAVTSPLKDVFDSSRTKDAPDGGRAKFVAVDIASGYCSDSGKRLGTAMHSDLTISFHRAKTGHFLSDCSCDTKKITIKDIGLPDFILPQILPPEAPALTRLTDGRQMRDALAKQVGHKYTHGHALILSGGAGRTGAARLAARGALRIGAGLVTLGVPGSAQMEVAAQITALMLRRVQDGAGLTEVLRDARVNALCLGPGLGLGEEKAGLVRAALEGRRATVLDADALTLMAERSELVQLLHGNCVLTPHAGEFGRLFPDIMEKLQSPASTGPAYSKVDATREAAARVGCTVLFKGPDTVISDPEGRCAINSAQYDRAAPWLATAGSGDVLAGFITGLLARGFAPMQAAETGAWLHVECARSFGPGLIAEDLPEELPKVLRALGI